MNLSKSLVSLLLTIGFFASTECATEYIHQLSHKEKKELVKILENALATNAWTHKLESDISSRA